jgi:hypothetical protein
MNTTAQALDALKRSEWSLTTEINRPVIRGTNSSLNILKELQKGDRITYASHDKPQFPSSPKPNPKRRKLNKSLIRNPLPRPRKRVQLYQEDTPRKKSLLFLDITRPKKNQKKPDFLCPAPYM